MSIDRDTFICRSLQLLASVSEVNTNKVDSLSIAVQYLLALAKSKTQITEDDIKFIERLETLIDDDKESVRKSYRMLKYVIENAKDFGGVDVNRS